MKKGKTAAALYRKSKVLLASLIAVCLSLLIISPPNIASAATMPSIKWTMNDGVSNISSRLDDRAYYKGSHYCHTLKNGVEECVPSQASANEDFDRWNKSMLDRWSAERVPYSYSYSPWYYYIMPDMQKHVVEIKLAEPIYWHHPLYIRHLVPGLKMDVPYETDDPIQPEVRVNGKYIEYWEQFVSTDLSHSGEFLFTLSGDERYLPAGTTVSLTYYTALSGEAQTINTMKIQASTNNKDWTTIGSSKTVRTGVITVKKTDASGHAVHGALLEVQHLDKRNGSGTIDDNGEVPVDAMYKWSKDADGVYYFDVNGSQKMTYDENGELRIKGLQGEYRLIEYYSPFQSTLRPITDITVSTDTNGTTTISTDYSKVDGAYNGSSRIKVNGPTVTISDISSVRNPLDDLKKLEDEGLQFGYTTSHYEGDWPYPIYEFEPATDANGIMQVSKPGTYYIPKGATFLTSSNTPILPTFTTSLSGWHRYWHSSYSTNKEKYDEEKPITDDQGTIIGLQTVLSDPNYYGPYTYRYVEMPSTATSADFDNLTAYAGNYSIAGFNGKTQRYTVDAAWLGKEFKVIGLPPNLGYSITSKRSGNTVTVTVTNSKNSSLNRSFTFVGGTVPTQSPYDPVIATKLTVTGEKLSNDNTINLTIGSTDTLSVQVEPVNATWRTATYTSSDPSVVNVAKDGTVQALAYGSAQITVTAAGKAVKITVNSTFKDVNAKTPHADDINWLAQTSITTGFEDGTFRGMSSVVRQDMAAFLRRLAKNNNISDAAAWTPSESDWKRFKDVNKNTPHAEDILWLAHAGISEGWEEKDHSYTFRGMSSVVRQDMAAFLRRLAKLAGKDNEITPKSDFTDVNAKTPHTEDIQWLGGSGVTEGYLNSDGKTHRFEGMTRVYRQDMAAFLHRLNTLLTRKN